MTKKPVPDAPSRLLGLLGHNISYSLSPYIHNFTAKKLGIDQIYVNFDLPPSDVKTFCDAFTKMGGVGLNITKPHKQAVAALFKERQNPYSVNTIFQKNGRYLATSTDGEGFRNALAHLRAKYRQFSQIVFLGGGGATMAILADIAKTGYKGNVVILRRKNTTDKICKKIFKKTSFEKFDPKILSHLIQNNPTTLLIQATSAPLGGNSLTEFCGALKYLRGAFVELNYRKHPALLKKARQLRIKSQDGLPMLIEQARLSQKLWWGKTLPYKTIERYLLQIDI